MQYPVRSFGARAPLRRFALFALLLFLSSSAHAQFTLEEYESWQRYTGWPIRVIEFPGIHAFARADLLTVMATEKPTWLRRYVPIGSRTTFYADDFATDLIRVRNFYAREGFPRAEVTGLVIPEEKQLRLLVRISEGEPLLLRSWRMQLAEGSQARVDSARWSAKLPIKIGKRISGTTLKMSADTLRYELQLNGHAKARVQVDTLESSTPFEADVVFKLNPGPYCRIGRTAIAGLKQVREPTARRELTYHEHDPYSPLVIEETRKRLLRLETFRLVRVELDSVSRADTIDVQYSTEEGNRYLIRTGGGYDTEDGARAEAKLTDLNFFGRARRFTTEVKASRLFGASDEVNRSIGFNLFWPHTPWNATDITLAPAWKYEFNGGAITETRSSTTILSAAPLRKTAISVSNEFGSQTVELAGQDTIPSETSTISIESFSIGWDTRDNPLVPRRGHFLSFSASESGAFWNIDNRWWRAVLGGRVLAPANRFTTFAFRGEAGAMGPLHQSEETPINERFRLGGASDIRGWGNDMVGPRTADGAAVLGGDVSMYASAEVRRQIWGPVTFVLFADAGNAWNDSKAVRLDDVYYAGGAGLQFLTPFGPVRTDFGYQLTENPYGERPWAIHLVLGSTF